jgi:hypothetical protein
MDCHDILFIVFDILADSEDVKSLVNCSNVNKLMNRTYKAYGKYEKLKSIKIYKLIISTHGLDIFKRELLELILVKTQISPMLSDIFSLVRFMRMTDKNVNLNDCLDRLIPNNLIDGNDMSYKPGELMPYLLSEFVSWLDKWAHPNKKIDIDLENLDEVWRILEEPLDDLYRLMFKFKCEDMTIDKQNDWYVVYDNFSLYSSQNIENEEKMTLYLNKLKVIYQLVN